MELKIENYFKEIYKHFGFLNYKYFHHYYTRYHLSDIIYDIY